MIKTAPYDDSAAWSVLSQLDASDLQEAQLARGQVTHPLQIFAEWRAVQIGAVMSYVLRAGSWTGPAFAVLAVGHTGQSGVAEAALLARDHTRFARPIGQTAALIRRHLPRSCEAHGIHRIEARCWAEHPTAARFLTYCGFAREADMPGFGPGGSATFIQFAWHHALAAPTGD